MENQIKSVNENVCRAIDGMIYGIELGHQMGQWSERRWWGQCLENERIINDEVLLCGEDQLNVLINNPPAITTPGWGPGFCRQQTAYRRAGTGIPVAKPSAVTGGDIYGA